MLERRIWQLWIITCGSLMGLFALWGWSLRESNDACWHRRAIRRNREKPAGSSGHRSRSNDEASVRGPHQGQQPIRTA